MVAIQRYKEALVGDRDVAKYVVRMKVPVDVLITSKHAMMA